MLRLWFGEGKSCDSKPENTQLPQGRNKRSNSKQCNKQTSSASNATDWNQTGNFCAARTQSYHRCIALALQKRDPPRGWTLTGTGRNISTLPELIFILNFSLQIPTAVRKKPPSSVHVAVESVWWQHSRVTLQPNQDKWQQCPVAQQKLCISFVTEAEWSINKYMEHVKYTKTTSGKRSG